MRGSDPSDWFIFLAVAAIALALIEWLRPLGDDDCRSCRGRGRRPRTSYVMRFGKWEWVTTYPRCRDCDGTGKIRR
jgi:hypothetical protein